MIVTGPSPSDRLLSTACYLGLAPVLRFRRSPQSNPFLQHHHAQAMAALFLVLVLLFAVCLFDICKIILVIQFPGFAQQLIDQWGQRLAYLDYTFWFPSAVLLALWIALLGLALGGSWRQLPFLKRLTRRPWIVRFSFLANCFVLAAIPVVAGFSLHASSLTRRSSEDAAAVYFLYDEGISVPRWGYALGLYRVSLQAQRNWGKGSTVLDRLNKETLRAALAHGRVVILATHGMYGNVFADVDGKTLCVGPPAAGATDETNNSHFLCVSVLGANNTWGPSENVDVNSELRLVYIFGCDAGKKASQWEEHLKPARVITYNRPSSIFDHGRWFALTGPPQLKKLQ